MVRTKVYGGICKEKNDGIAIVRNEAQSRHESDAACVAEKVAGGKFLAIDRSNMQSISRDFGKLLCILQEQIPPPQPYYASTEDIPTDAIQAGNMKK